MPVRSNLAEANREARATVTALREEWSERFQRLGEYGYAQLIANSPVVTGAYRAEHVIEQDGAPIFEHPQRPGPDAVVQTVGSFVVEFEGPAVTSGGVIGPPDMALVAAALASAGTEIRGFTYVNRRFYAAWLEDGTAHTEPRRIYARAEDATRAYAQQLALEPYTRPELRRLR